MNHTDINGAASATPPIDSTDAAWVSIPAKQSPAQLAKLCSDIEAIIRVNPYYVYNEKWSPVEDNCFRVNYNNLSNLQDVEQTLCVKQESEFRWVVSYDSGIKTRTVFEITRGASGDGSMLTITDDYQGLTDEAREARKDEVDKSLKAWGQGLYTYFKRWARLSWIPGWKWYTRRVWIPMKPSARRITYMLLMMEAAFIVLFAFSILILWIERNYPG